MKPKTSKDQRPDWRALAADIAQKNAARVPGLSDATITNYRYVPAPKNALPSDQYVITNVTGNSLSKVGIREGDWIMWKMTSKAKPGDLVVVSIPTGVTVKFYHPRPDGEIVLSSKHRAIRDHRYLPTEIEIRGVVVTNGHDWTEGGI